MKRKLVLLLTSAMVLSSVAMAGCGAKEETAEDNTEAAVDAETEDAADEAEDTADEADAADTETSDKMSGKITVVSREDGSGTRGAFIELFGVEQKNDAGEKVDYTTVDAEITNNTSVMMTTVAGNPSAIGYISLGSLNDTVKAVKIDGVEASVDNVKSGDYKVSRPFNIVTKDDLSEVAQDFIDFILSTEGQAVVEENGYIPLDGVEAYAGTAPAGKVVVAGSSSVTPVMEKLKEAYAEVNPNAEIEIQQSDSTTGVNSAIEGICDIGMASRDLKEEETGVTATVIATDGIAVIVNLENPTDDLTVDQVKSIYVGETTAWDEI
ncbi:MAG: substrate-binding domain-containing protein [Lachnospiraceae bacterium]|nr:substrate-binding domain-containing protein [Lachnospiraceae bacterium]